MTSERNATFSAIPGFDAAMRHIVSVPKEAVDKQMAAEKKAKAKAKKTRKG